MHLLSILLLGLLGLLTCSVPGAAWVASWEFTETTAGWVANDMVSKARITREGWAMDLKAPDPALTGPPMDWPAGQIGQVTLRMRSDSDALGQIYYGTGFSEVRSRAFVVTNDGQWHEYRIPLPKLETGSRLRVDPGHQAGAVTLAWIRVEAGADVFREPWATGRELRGKKIIGGGQYTTVGGEAATTPRFLARNPAFFDAYPFDGMIIPAVIDGDWAERLGLPRRDYFLHELLWNTVALPYEALTNSVADLTSVRWGGVTDNFLNLTLVDGARGRFTPDLADDHDWRILERNAAMAARLCREAKLQGFWLDTEQYGNYRWRTASGVPEFETNRPANIKFPLGKDSPELLRRRGAQWIRAVQAELPAVKIMITFAWSPDAVGYEPLQGTIGFLDGVLDALQAPGQLIHGYENTFYFGQGAGTTHAANSGILDGFPGDRGRFDAARTSIREWRTLSANPVKYDALVKVGMAAWVEDDPWNLWSGWPSGTRESFWSNLPLALAFSDEYVWVWSEHTRYGQASNTALNPFLASLRNRTFNTGSEEVADLKEDFEQDPLQHGWHFDFDMLAIGRKKDPDAAVPVMSPEAVPYGWDPAEKAVWVRTESSPGTGGQRRRYVHPIRPVHDGEDFRATLEFRVKAFGGHPEDPLVLGLFSSDRTLDRGSLTLQISAPDQVRVVLSGEGESQSMPLSIPGGLRTGQSYRVDFEARGPAGSLRARLYEASRESVPLAQIRFHPLAANRSVAWDELGIALSEAPAILRSPGEDSKYCLQKVFFNVDPAGP